MLGALFPFLPTEGRERCYNRSPVELLRKPREIKAEKIAGTASAIEGATYRCLIGKG